MNQIDIPEADWARHLIPGTEFVWDPQCAAITRRGHQCKNPVFFGQAYTYGVNNQPVMDQGNWALYLEGLCPIHRKLAS